jgi:phage gp36-like protein
MSYASKQNMIDRFGSDELKLLTDRATPPAGAIDDNILAQALSDADAEINSYIAKRVATPIVPVPQRVLKVACDIARFYLHKDHAPEFVRDAYDDAIKWLAAVSRGDAALGDDESATAVPVAGKPAYSGPARKFSRDTLKDY